MCFAFLYFGSSATNVEVVGGHFRDGHEIGHADLGRGVAIQMSTAP